MTRHFDLDEIGHELSAAVAAVIADETPEEDLWPTLAEMGVLDLFVPEESGGLGFGEEHFVAVLAQLGRRAFGEPVLETMCLRPLLSASDAPEDSPAERLSWAADDEHLPWPEKADRCFVGGLRADALAEITQTSPVEAAIDETRPLARVAGQHDLEISGAEVRQAWHRGALGSAALMVGLMRELLDLTVAYVKDRSQFGVPIGSFQAVQHHIASAKVEVDAAWPVVLEAAWSAQHRPTEVGESRISGAKYLVGAAARRVALLTIQCHGGMGYTTEYPLHGLVKRIWALDAAFGDGATHLSRVADDLDSYTFDWTTAERTPSS